MKKILLEIKKKHLPFENRAVESIDFISDKCINIDVNRIEYLRGEASNIAMDNEMVDIVFSNAVLEHVHDVGKAISEISRVTKKGGMGIHEIDLRDHFFQSTPLRLLQYPDWLWNLMGWYRPGYTNRLRFSDFLSLFNSVGFLEKKMEITRKFHGDVLYIKKHKNFSRYPMEELKILSFQVLLKKNDTGM